MSLSGIPNASLNMSQPQAAWDAIATIKANSPFAASADARTSSAAATLDAMLPGYGTMSALGQPAGTSGQDGSLAAITERVRAAEQSTIDLFA